MDSFADSYAARRDAGALHRLQSHGEVPRPAQDGARARRRGAGDRPLCAAACRARRGPSCIAAPIRRATRATSCSARRPSSSTSCAFRSAHLPKSETRALAERFDLPVADKPDSQDICFVPNGDYAAVVQKLRPEANEPGEIVDMAGRVVGRHDGIVRFTVGQRRGLALGEPRAAPTTIRSMSCGSSPRRAASSSARARRSAAARSRSTT